MKSRKVQARTSISIPIDHPIFNEIDINKCARTESVDGAHIYVENCDADKQFLDALGGNILILE